MEKATRKLSLQLLNGIYTTAILKQVSDALEDISQNTTFKQHASSIVTDENLTDNQKRTQLLYLIRGIEIPHLYEFFSDTLNKDQYWLFHSDKIDYFDKFVQDFQKSTEELKIVHLVSSISLVTSDLKGIAKSLKDNLGFKVLINHEVNRSIIGGVQVKIENYVFDYSLRHKFQQFQRQWLKSLNKVENAVGKNLPD